MYSRMDQYTLVFFLPQLLSLLFIFSLCLFLPQYAAGRAWGRLASSLVLLLVHGSTVVQLIAIPRQGSLIGTKREATAAGSGRAQPSPLGLSQSKALFTLLPPPPMSFLLLLPLLVPYGSIPSRRACCYSSQPDLLAATQLVVSVGSALWRAAVAVPAVSETLLLLWRAHRYRREWSRAPLIARGERRGDEHRRILAPRLYRHRIRDPPPTPLAWTRPDIRMSDLPRTAAGVRGASGVPEQCPTLVRGTPSSCLPRASEKECSCCSTGKRRRLKTGAFLSSVCKIYRSMASLQLQTNKSGIFSINWMVMVNFKTSKFILAWIQLTKKILPVSNRSKTAKY